MVLFNELMRACNWSYNSKFHFHWHSPLLSITCTKNHFLGIPFSFQSSPLDLWNVVLAKIEKKLQYWITKPLSLVGKSQVCSKVLATTHVHYYSCWASSKASYLNLEKLLCDFLWASRVDSHEFHKVAWEYYWLTKDAGGLGLISTKKHGTSLCVKWVIRAITGDKFWKVLLKHCISSNFLVNKLSWKGIGFQTFLTMSEPMHI